MIDREEHVVDRKWVQGLAGIQALARADLALVQQFEALDCNRGEDSRLVLEVMRGRRVTRQQSGRALAGSGAPDPDSDFLERRIDERPPQVAVVVPAASGRTGTSGRS